MADRSPSLPPELLLPAGVVGGVAAGLVFGGLATAVAPLLGGTPGDPWQAAASVFLWRQAVAGPATFGVLLAGVACHLAIAAFYGMVWGLAVGKLPVEVRDDWGFHAGAATAYGVLVYVVNVQLVGRLLYPWMPATAPFAQLLLHGLAYGLPLGLYLCARVRPHDRFRSLSEDRARARRDAERPPA